MKLRTINDLIIGKVPSLDKNNADHRLRTTEYVNFSIDAIWRAANWEFRKKNAQLMIEPSITTGTCSYTKLGRTVTFVGITVESNWQGRYFVPKDSSSQYKIIQVDTALNTITTDTPIIDNSASGKEYTVWKRFYSLKSDVDTLVDIRRWDGGGSLVYKSDPKLSQNFANIGEEGSPYYFSIQGIDEYDDAEYKTGTVEGTENTNTLTGLGTAFIGNCDVGDIITINNDSYRIKSVESDTSLKLQNFLISTISASTFSIKKNNPLNITFYYPPDSYRTLDYSYLSKAPELKNDDYDELKLERDYIDAIVMRTQAYWLEEKDLTKYQILFALAEAKIKGLRAKKPVVNPRFRQFEPLINGNLPGRG